MQRGRMVHPRSTFQLGMLWATHSLFPDTDDLSSKVEVQKCQEGSNILLDKDHLQWMFRTPEGSNAPIDT
mgnify:CR=1 FL=1